jgi:hypothetical protein
MKVTYTKRIGMGLMIAALAGGVCAAEPNTDDTQLLRGPQVVESSGPDAGDSMTGERSGARPTGDMPFRAYLGAVRGLHKAAKDNPELALTDEQKQEIRAIGDAHKEKMKAFMDAHKDELAEFRGKHGQKGQRGGAKRDHPQRDGDHREIDRADHPARDEAVDRPSPEQRQRAREKMGELMAKAPSDQDAKKQLWAVLSPEQQAAVKANIKDMRAKRQAKIDEGFNRRGHDNTDNAAKRKEKRQEQQGLRRAKKSDSKSDD